MNFHNIESFVIERRWETFAREQDMITQHHIMTEQMIQESDFWTSTLSNAPSNDIISKCFLARFLQEEQLYLKEMTASPVSDSISFDHTFKVAANIGFLREDGRWIHQYDSLFIVMNGAGQIVTWQLSKGTAFCQVGTLLKDLKKRSSSLKTVYIDDCCKLRAKITSVFGEGVSVKLDLFHAVQRITNTLHKKHPLVHQCMQDLQLVFRQDGDSGEKRMATTPSPQIILSKLSKFEDKWKVIQGSSTMHVFTSATLLAIDRLKHHISSGCISNIPPGGGTNRNERFHHHINSLFNRSKMGILLAYTLLTVVMHSYNSSKKNTQSHGITTNYC